VRRPGTRAKADPSRRIDAGNASAKPWPGIVGKYVSENFFFSSSNAERPFSTLYSWGFESGLGEILRPREPSTFENAATRTGEAGAHAAQGRGRRFCRSRLREIFSRRPRFAD